MLVFTRLISASYGLITERQTQRQRTAAQVLMTECPLNTRCVSRNFCDNTGMVTLTRQNDLNFEQDKRGFIACVDSSRNVLGVCCVELQTILQGDGGPIRQDDVFTVRIKFRLISVTQ